MSLQRFKIDIASTVVNQQNAGLNTMETDQILDLFNLGETAGAQAEKPRPPDGSNIDEMVDEEGNVKKQGEKGWLNDLGELWDEKLGRAKRPPPSLADAASFYSHAAGINPQTFMKTAAQFGIDVKARQADELIALYGVAETPSIVVNGKYRLNPVTAGGDEPTLELVKWLVAKESSAPASAASH